MVGGLHPVVLCGGGGERLWPLSRAALAKQLIRLEGRASLFERTLDRIAEALDDPSALMVLCNEADRFIVSEQMRSRLGAAGRIILEPARRDTAAAIALAAAIVCREDPNGLMLVCPADHLIHDLEGFGRTIAAALPAARDGRIVTIGITPSEPHTGYGYIEAGPVIGSGPERDVFRFVEKPSKRQAERMLAAGNCFWNAGIFLFRADVMAAAMRSHYALGFAAAERATAQMEEDLDFLRIDAGEFNAAPTISIDYAVIEKVDNIAVVPASFGWNDVGSWLSLSTAFATDNAGNATFGAVTAIDTKNSIIYSDDAITTATFGVEELIVVATRDAVMVVPKTAAQDVKRIVARLRDDGHRQADEHSTTFRPWGNYQRIAEGARYQVKRICVKPGGRLSLQHHHHRAEHWIVVKGTAKIEIDHETRLLSENESVYIPIGSPHRLENPGKIDLELIEVQTGSYLDEDDIVRLVDSYSR